MGEVLINVDIQAGDVNKVLDATVWLLDQKQPNELQEKGNEFFRKLFAFDKTTVYVKLMKYPNVSIDAFMPE